MLDDQGDVTRYEHIAGMLAKIHTKHNEGPLNLAFIVLVTPDLSKFDAEAVDFVLDDLLAKPKPEWWKDGYPCYGTLYQGVRQRLAVMGLPDPENEEGAVKTRQIHHLSLKNSRPN